MRKAFLCLGCFAVAAASGVTAAVQAAQVTSNLGVTITITNECTAGSTSPVNFGSHGVLNSNFDATGTISVTCTTSAPYTIGLGLGNGSGATVAVRKMTGGGTATVGYQLYRESTRTDIWGEIDTSDEYSGSGSGSAQNITVYGRVGPQATPPADTYNDTVLVTIKY